MGKKASQQRTALIVLAAVGGGMLLVCGGVVAVYVAAVGWHLTQPPKPKVYEREELRQLITGKTPEEVIQLLGKPDHTNDTGGNADWTYRGISYDKTSGQTDNIIHIGFRNGRAVEVRF